MKVIAGLPPRPRRRATTHVEALHGELCIYEWTTRTVHALNPAAARVWDMCDGVTTVEEMTAALRDAGTPRAAAIVAHALGQFDRAGLLEPGTPSGAGPLVSRRALLRTIGVAAAIPVVTSIVAPPPLAAQSGGNIRQFISTGAPQSFTVPAGIASLQVDVLGASGAGVIPSPAGAGGRVQATLPVTPGETLTIVVGSPGSTDGLAAFNGGGAGLNGGFSGGGASDIRRGSTIVIVAGGGGAGGPLGGGTGGAGGGLTGGAGAGFCGGGGGGTQSAGGAGGSGSGAAGSPGTSGTGGQGAPATPPGLVGGSGGGGGFFGGGGGGACGVSFNSAAGGGGGSSFTDPSATGVVHTQGLGGSPRIILTW